MSRSEKIRERLFECFHNDEIENGDMVKMVERLADILNLKTVTNYAASEGISYNGAKKREKPYVIIDGQMFVVNNK